MVPSILRGVNLVAIAPPKKGKSVGLIMSILQKVATKPVSRTRSFNPLAIILCTSWKKVDELSDIAEKFTMLINESNKLRKPKIVSAYAGPTEKKIMISVLSGCDILITTPKCLIRMLKTHEFFKLNELEIMALDDAEILIAYHLDVLKEIFIYKQTGMYESGNGVLQIVTATNWTSGLESFVRNEMGNMFMLTVNNPMEIAVFERLTQKLVEYGSQPMDLYEQLLTYLQMKESNLRRTIIFASDDRRITAIYRFLMQKVTFDLKLMLGSMTSVELKQTETEWNQYRGYLHMPILLISDEALGSSTVSIFNAHNLFHADINPALFGTRLNFLRDKFSELSFLSPASSTTSTETEQTPFHSYVFLCPATIELSHANFLYKFLGRCHSDRPKWLQEKTIDYVLTKEKSKFINEICPQIKHTGECQFPACNKRHIVLSDIDKPLLPNRGQIKFRLLYLVSPSHFYVRIMEHKIPNESLNSQYKSRYTSLKMNLIRYFNDPKNVQGVNPRCIKPGFIAAIRVKDILERVMVMKMKSSKSVRMDVKLIDHGSTMVVEQCDLLTLPRELQEVPAQAVEVFVVGIRPLDNDEHYHKESAAFAQKFLDGKDLYGVIMLCIGKTIWLDSVTQLVHHKTTNISVYEKSLSIELAEKDFAEKNSGHIQKLIRLCTGKIDIWNSSSQLESPNPIPIMRKFTYTKEPLRFEELTIQSEDDDIVNDCTVMHVLSPHLIFLSNRDTKESIKQMQKEMCSLIESIETMPLDRVQVGDCVLFCAEGVWLRGYVVSREGAEVVRLFSLDWGTLTTHAGKDTPLKRLPTEYQQLPYHAVLAGLRHCHPGHPFSADVCTVIDNFVSSPDKRLLVSVIAYSAETMEDPAALLSDPTGSLLQLQHLDLCRHLKRYSVTIAKKTPGKGDCDQELFNVLVHQQCLVPSQEWVYIVLPECEARLSRLERSGSIPHLGADILGTTDPEKRLKVAAALERLVTKNISHYEARGCVAGQVDGILNTIFVLLHFVSEQPVFMCFYRSLKALLNLAYSCKLPMNGPESEEQFSVAYISDMVYSYQSIVGHILTHLNVTVRNNRLEDCATFLDMLKLLLINTGFANNFLEEDSWPCVMATCIGTMEVDDGLYNGLMDLLVQLVMLVQGTEGGARSSLMLAGVLDQCCVTVAGTASVSVWQSTAALLSCMVHCRQYWPLLRDRGLLTVLLERMAVLRPWAEVHEASLDLVAVMWASAGSGLAKDWPRLGVLLRGLLDVAGSGPAREVLARLMSEVAVAQSSVDSGLHRQDRPDPARPRCTAPDTDALDWSTGKDHGLARRQRRCYRKIFEEDGQESDGSDHHQREDGGSSVDSDSDCSNVEVTNFLNDTNPADEDNVPCYDRP